MLHSVSDLLRYDAMAGEDRLAINELFFSTRTWRGAFLGVDPGAGRQVVIAAGLLGEIDAAERSVSVNVSRRTLASAPKWTPQERLETPAMAQDPAMVAALSGWGASPLAAPMVETAPAAASDPVAEVVEERFDRATVWIGANVYGRDGRLGVVDDLLFTPDGLTISHFVIDNGRLLPGRQLAVPVDLFSSFEDEGRSLVLDLTEKRLNEAPQIETMDRVERHWVDTLRTYFQLPV